MVKKKHKNTKTQKHKKKKYKYKLQPNYYLDYTQLHNDIIKGREDQRFVTCSIINGWGNAIQEALSCFIFAFVTNRAVIFNTHGLGLFFILIFLEKKKIMKIKLKKKKKNE